MEQEKLQSIIESLLFLSGEPLAVSKLSHACGADEDEVLEAIEGLRKTYEQSGRGLAVVRHGDEVQLATRPENAAYLEQVVKDTLQETLSRAALEVLSVIAYRGPISRAEIEAIRGVNCSLTLRNLLMRELIERQDNPADSRGYVYTVSLQFLRELGLENLSDLPDYESLRKDERIERLLSEAGQSGTDEQADVQSSISHENV